MKRYIFKETNHYIELPNKNNEVYFKYFSDIHKSLKDDPNILYSILDRLNSSNTEYVGIGGDIIDLTDDIKSKNERKIIIEWLKEISSHYRTFISLGNHDFLKKTDKGYVYDYVKDFWEEINSIDDIYLSHFKSLYEDNNIIVYMPELGFNYYENINHTEDINILLEKLKNDKKLITNLDNKKIKIMMIHSPYLLDNKEVLDLIKEFDIVLSGHMHRGLMLPVFNRLINNNIGIVTPHKKFFKDNCRGVKTLKIDNKEILLIISGGITKLSNNTGILSNLNFIYPKEIENIEIHSKKYNLKRKV